MKIFYDQPTDSDKTDFVQQRDFVGHLKDDDDINAVGVAKSLS